LIIHTITSCLRDERVIASLASELASLSDLLRPNFPSFTIWRGVLAVKFLDAFKIKVLILIRQVHALELVFLRADLDLERHQGVVQQPVLGVEGEMVLALNERNASTNIKLVLEIADQLE
jgi:hypothetical protein